MPGESGGRRYTEAELERLLEARVRRTLTDEMVTTIKSTVNGLKNDLLQFGTDLKKLRDDFDRELERRQDTAAKILAALDVVILPPEDREELADMLEERREQRNRRKFHQTVMGQVSIGAGIAYVGLQFFLFVHNTVLDPTHPIHL